MSKLEDRIEKSFIENGISYEKQKPIIITDYPWKTNRSRSSPKVDFYLPENNLYIEIKGFMTMEAMSKMSFLARQCCNYYIFQGTEYEWNPFIENDTPIKSKEFKGTLSNSKQLELNISEQINEICTNTRDYFDNISSKTLLRFQDFIRKKIDQYEKWNGVWY